MVLSVMEEDAQIGRHAHEVRLLVVSLAVGREMLQVGCQTAVLRVMDDDLLAVEGA